MKPIFLKGSFIPLTIIEKLYSLAIKHSIAPVSFVLLMTAIPEEQSVSALHPVLKITFIPTSISPIEGAPSSSLAHLKLSLIKVVFFASPMIGPSAFLFVIFEFAQVVVAGGEVKLARAFELAVVELTVYYFVCCLEKA